MVNDGLHKPSGIALLRCLLGRIAPPTAEDNNGAATADLDADALPATPARPARPAPIAPAGGWHVDELDTPDGLPRTYTRRS